MRGQASSLASHYFVSGCVRLYQAQHSLLALSGIQEDLPSPCKYLIEKVILVRIEFREEQLRQRESNRYLYLL